MTADKERLKVYEHTRDDLLKRQLSNAEKHDGAILTLSTGALGISLAFIKDIVPVSQARHLWVLVVSWVVFGAAVVATIVSFMTSQKGITRQLEYAKEYYLNEKDEYLNKTNRFGRATSYLNVCSGVLFIVGIICTIVFVSSNMGGGIKMTSESKPAAIQEGAPIPQMQPAEAPTTEQRGAPIPSMQPVKPATPAQVPTASGQSGHRDSGSNR